jgi:hypothetical protein
MSHTTKGKRSPRSGNLIRDQAERIADAKRRYKMERDAWILYCSQALIILLISTLMKSRTEGDRYAQSAIALYTLIPINVVSLGMCAKSKGHSALWGLLATPLLFLSIGPMLVFRNLPAGDITSSEPIFEPQSAGHKPIPCRIEGLAEQPSTYNFEYSRERMKLERKTRYLCFCNAVVFLIHALSVTNERIADISYPAILWPIFALVIINAIFIGQLAKTKGYSLLWGAIAILLVFYNFILLIIFMLLHDSKRPPSPSRSKG